VPGDLERDVLLFEELVDRHVDLVYHMARAWSGNAADADELTQTAFIKAWRAFDRFKAGTNFKAWVLKILRNAFIDHRRAQSSGVSTSSLDQIAPDDEPQQQPPPPRVIDLESKEVFYDVFADEIARLLRQMPVTFQLPVLLCDVEGLSYREVAEVLGVALGTVMSRLYRARSLLSKELGELAAEHGINVMEEAA